MKEILKQDLKAFSVGWFQWWWNQDGNNTEQGFEAYWKKLKRDVIDKLDTLEENYFIRKQAISNNIGVPVSVLTILLKEMKLEGTVFLSAVFSEVTGMPNGSGYALVSNNVTTRNLVPSSLVTDYRNLIINKFPEIYNIFVEGGIITVEEEWEDDMEDPCKNDDDCCDEARKRGEEIVKEFPKLEVVEYYCHRHKYSIVTLKLRQT